MTQDNNLPEDDKKDSTDKFRRILSSQNEESNSPNDFELPEGFELSEPIDPGATSLDGRCQQYCHQIH